MDPTNENQSGLYVAVEGGEGSGKSTAIAAAKDVIGECVVTREPGGTSLSEDVRHILQADGRHINPRSEFALFWASRFAAIEEVVVANLAAGRSVISDRCAASTWAYQVRARELPELVEPFWSLWNILPRTPDLYVFLDLDPEEGLRRIFTNRLDEVSRIDRESLPFHRRVREGYREFFSAMPPEKVVTIDASRPKDEVAQMVADVIRRFRAPT